MKKKWFIPCATIVSIVIIVVVLMKAISWQGGKHTVVPKENAQLEEESTVGVQEETEDEPQVDWSGGKTSNSESSRKEKTKNGDSKHTQENVGESDNSEDTSDKKPTIEEWTPQPNTEDGWGPIL